MTIRRWTGMPVVAAMALVLMGAGPSVGDRIAALPQASPPVAPGPCQDDSAVLVTAGGAADGVLFRCAGGVPVPRQGPWSTDGCPGQDYSPEAMLVVTPGSEWQPDTACLITTPVDVVRVVMPGSAAARGK
jgi:hypothetical protein